MLDGTKTARIAPYLITKPGSTRVQTIILTDKLTSYLVYPSKIEVWGNYDLSSFNITPYDYKLKAMVQNHIQGSVMDVFSANSYSLMLTADGTLYGTGLNERGQLGDGSGINAYTPVPVSTNDALNGKKIAYVFPGETGVIVSTNDSRLYGWGDLGQCYSISPMYSPVYLNFDKPIASIVHSTFYTYVLTRDGNVYTCSGGSIVPATLLINTRISAQRRLLTGFYASTSENIILVSVPKSLAPYLTSTKLYANEYITDNLMTGVLKLDLFTTKYSMNDVHRIIVWNFASVSRISILFKSGDAFYGENGQVFTYDFSINTKLTSSRVIVMANGTVYSNTVNGIQAVAPVASGLQKLMAVTSTVQGVTGVFASCLKENYVGDRCDIPVCYGLNATDKNVCSGVSQGRCTSPGNCECVTNYGGVECQSYCGLLFSGRDCTKLTAGAYVLIALGSTLLFSLLCIVVGVMALCTTRYRRVVIRQEKAEIEMKNLLEESLIRADSLAEQVDRDWVIPFTDIKFIERLAEGSFGVVMKAKYQGADV
jgi:hypothetical protein